MMKTHSVDKPQRRKLYGLSIEKVIVLCENHIIMYFTYIIVKTVSLIS